MVGSSKGEYLEREIARLNQEKRRLLRQVQGQRRHIEGLERWVNALRDSTSWRVTKPWRAVGTFVHGFGAGSRKAFVTTGLFLIGVVPGGRDALQKFLSTHPKLRKKLKRLTPSGTNPELSVFQTTAIPSPLSPLENEVFQRLITLGTRKQQ